MADFHVIDKSWIDLKFPDQRFIDGVKNFVEFTKTQPRYKFFIACPCTRCRNLEPAVKHDIAIEHCYRFGFDKTYRIWSFHGEKYGEGVGGRSRPRGNDNQADINDAFNIVLEGFNADNLDEVLRHRPGHEEFLDDVAFTSNLREAMHELYPGANFTVLKFVVKLFNLKITHGCTNQFFSELLQLIKLVLPPGNKTPENAYKADKIIRDLSLTYEKIDACRNDCMIYWGEYESATRCHDCGMSRYTIASIDQRKVKARVPAKVFRYFPLTSRLRRLYGVDWVAKHMCWHVNGKSSPGKMGHPVDSVVWKKIDSKYPDFSSEPRNVRLGLATDGFNPFSNLSTSYSSWPMMCVNYNLPPWLCVKPQFIMLVGLIEGPRQPGKDICIYMQPFVKDMLKLWHDGVMIRDAFRGDVFNLHAVLLWTIHDFPALGNISGCKTKGRYGCPPCGMKTATVRLRLGKKNVYLRHRRWLSLRDPLRNDTRESTFDKTQERDGQPLRLTGIEVDNMTRNLKMKWGKGKQANQPDNEGDSANSCFYKRSILFELPYWKDIPIRHNLDVMHIEKNVCEILLSLMLNTKGKTKDDVNARKDLKHLKIKKNYWVKEINGKKKIRPGILWLQKEEKTLFLQTLSNLSVPVGFSSNWARLVKEDSLNLKGLKSHDYHILMQHLLPVLIQHAYKDGARKEARTIITSICTFFGALCSRTLDIESLNVLERGMVKTLCALERVCPPSVFVVMMHLPIHLAYEARVNGPVWARWMYTFERMMKDYKAYVLNKARPEGSIAERYLREETLNFCTGYNGRGGILEKLDRKAEGLNPALPNLFDSIAENPNANEVGPVGASKYYSLPDIEFAQVYNWVLKSHPSYEDWHARYLKFVEDNRAVGRRLGQGRQPVIDDFIPWLKKQTESIASNDLFKDIVRGPTQSATKYNKYCVNGFLFITKDYQEHKVNQNSSVSTSCLTTFRSSAKDKNPVDDYAQYYGVLRKIIQVEYREGYKPVLFKCDWVKCTQHGMKLDKEANLRLVNLSNLLSSTQMHDEPFILAEHAMQVFYSKDLKSPQWNVVIEVPRKVYSDQDETFLLSEDRVVTELDIGASNVGPSIEDELIFNNDNGEDWFEVVENNRKRKRATK